MKKLFISQPMRGKTDEQILAEREEAIRLAKEILNEDVEVLDTFFKDLQKPLHYIAKSIEYLADADIVFFAQGWQNARGCKIEHTCATEYGVKLIYGGKLI